MKDLTEQIYDEFNAQVIRMLEHARKQEEEIVKLTKERDDAEARIVNLDSFKRIAYMLKASLRASGGDAAEIAKLEAYLSPETVRQLAPALQIKPWEQRMDEAGEGNCVGWDAAAMYIEAEIADLRSALAATAAPVLSAISRKLDAMESCDYKGDEVIRAIRTTLAALAAPVLSDEQIGEIADNFKFKDHWQSNAEAIRFARAILSVTTTYSR